jgi:hypothetical protein
MSSRIDGLFEYRAHTGLRPNPNYRDQLENRSGERVRTFWLLSSFASTVTYGQISGIDAINSS